MRASRGAPRTTAAALVALAAVAVLAGCSQVQDGAKQAVGDAASKATDQAKDTARDAAIGQVCDLTRGSGPLSDGAVGANEQAVIGTVEAVAEQAGVPATYTRPLKELATAQSASASQDAIAKLTKACAGR